MAQLTYVDQGATLALEGGLYDVALADKVSRTPGANVAQVDTIAVTTVIAAVAQVMTLTITTAADADVFTIKINGVVVATGTSSGTDKTVQRDAIEALLEANAYFIANFTSTDNGTDALDITALDAGTPFTMEETVTSSSAWDITEDTANTIGTWFRLTVDGHTVSLAAASTTEETESDLFLAAIVADTAISALVTAAEGTGAAITLTAVTAGTPFTATFTNTNAKGETGSGDVAKTTTTANVTGNPVPFGRGLARNATAGQAVLPSATSFTFEGVSINRAKALAKDSTGLGTATAQWDEAEAMSVLRKGRIWVIPEDAVTPESDVYIRHTASVTAGETPGRFRTDGDSATADQLSNARWITSASAGALAVLEINTP